LINLKSYLWLITRFSHCLLVHPLGFNSKNPFLYFLYSEGFDTTTQCILLNHDLLWSLEACPTRFIVVKLLICCPRNNCKIFGKGIC
jgi:hypothetical protein